MNATAQMEWNWISFRSIFRYQIEANFLNAPTFHIWDFDAWILIFDRSIMDECRFDFETSYQYLHSIRSMNKRHRLIPGHQWSRDVPLVFSLDLLDRNVQFFCRSITNSAKHHRTIRARRNRSLGVGTSVSRSFGARRVARNIEECEM